MLLFMKDFVWAIGRVLRYVAYFFLGYFAVATVLVAIAKFFEWLL